MDKSLVSKATADSAEPTPGYMFNEIARITHASVDACLQLEKFLLKRLKKDSVHVKLKVLRVIKHCCQHGHATFRREMPAAHDRHQGMPECVLHRFPARETGCGGRGRVERGPGASPAPPAAPAGRDARGQARPLPAAESPPRPVHARARRADRVAR